MGKLTKRAIDALEPAAADYFKWDGELPGFGVRVWPTGRKVYVAQYRAGGRVRRFKLGVHGVLTVEEARKEARKVLGDVARGEDPQEDRITGRKGTTVAELADRYLADAAKGLIMGKGGQPKRASTLALDAGRIEHFIKPLIGGRKLRDLAHADVVRMMNEIATGKVQKSERSEKLRGKTVVTGGRTAASRAVGLLGSMLTYARARGLIEHNPAAGVKRPADGVRRRRFGDEELRALGAAIEAADHEPWQGVAFTALALLTGWRRNELHALRWDQLDLASATARLEATKEGYSLRPLAAPVVDLLKAIERTGDYVLPPARGGIDTSPNYRTGHRVFARLCEAAKVPPASPHTARHTFVSVATEIGFSEALAGACVGHLKGGTVTARNYTHLAPKPLIAVADAVAADMLRRMGLKLPLRSG